MFSHKEPESHDKTDLNFTAQQNSWNMFRQFQKFAWKLINLCWQPDKPLAYC